MKNPAPLKSVILSAGVFLAACSVLPERTPVDLFQLPPASLSASGSDQRLTSLRISRPQISEALGGNRLLIMTGNNSFQAYPEARWTTTVPLLWRDWLLDAFWRDGRVQALSAASEGLQSSSELGGMLRAFHVDSSSGQPRAVIQFDAMLIDVATRRIIASYRFEAQQTLTGTDVSAAVAALGLASNRLAEELIAWVVSQEARAVPD